MSEVAETPIAKQGESLTLLLREVLDKRDEKNMGDLRTQILSLTEPDREIVNEVLPGGDAAESRGVPGYEGVSRGQPTDPLYRKLSKDHDGAFDECRSPEKSKHGGAPA